jgi:hypothetical protein
MVTEAKALLKMVVLVDVEGAATAAATEAETACVPGLVSLLLSEANHDMDRG